ncbi:hypothetical protein TanjilG_08467 [Lupinus angustifolius]|uniref:Bromo domain-containing protein n=1 Tax=Lupinus angustifolius TaxID=3871 RepID=A0A1J7H4P4_LUPAN|nr:hypothetical protein TanjilG_08467 [Lupinus angustifolius]
MPRKELVLYVPRSHNQKREPSQFSSSDTRCNKRCKVMASSDTEYSSVPKTETTRVIAAKDSRNVDEDVAKMRKVAHDQGISAYPTKSGGKADKCGGLVKEKWRVSKSGCEEKEKKKPLDKRVITKDSRSVYEEKCEKMRNVASHYVSAINTDQYPTKSSAQCCGAVKEKGNVGLRISRSGFEEGCKLKKKKKEEKKERVMDHCKKMQCWVILKRLMTGRDSWVFKQPMMGLKILDNNNNNSIVDHYHESKSVSKPSIKSEVVCNKTSMKPNSLKDIESKLRKLVYTDADEFAEDIRVIFSYGFLHPPRNDIYKITSRLSEAFELTWKSLKEKWLIK